MLEASQVPASAVEVPAGSDGGYLIPMLPPCGRGSTMRSKFRIPSASSSGSFPSSSSRDAPALAPIVVKTESVDDEALARAYQKAEEMALESPIAISESPSPRPRRGFACSLRNGTLDFDEDSEDLDEQPSGKKPKNDVATSE